MIENWLENYISALHCLNLPVVDLDQCVSNLQARLVVNILQLYITISKWRQNQSDSVTKQSRKGTFSAGLNLTTLLTQSSTLPPSPILQINKVVVVSDTFGMFQCNPPLSWSVCSKYQCLQFTQFSKLSLRRPKREFNIVMSGQFRTFAMFFQNIKTFSPLNETDPPLLLQAASPQFSRHIRIPRLHSLSHLNNHLSLSHTKF